MLDITKYCRCVVPPLPMLLAFPYLLPRLGFWGALDAGIGLTIACVAGFALVTRRLGIEFSSSPA